MAKEHHMHRKDLLDLGRFCAAVSVMFFHYFFSGIYEHKVESIGLSGHLSDIAVYGYMGVPFFFMISGYVICFSAEGKTAYQFLVSRFTRLYPSYWFAVLLTSTAILLLNHNPLMAITWHAAIVDLTMFQNYFRVKSVDGVYWTLFYELKFYLLVFLFILLFKKQVLTWFFRLWPVLILLASMLGKPVFIFDWQFAYFAFGALLAVYERKKTALNIVPLMLSIVMCFYAEYATDIIPRHIQGNAVNICYGLIALFIVFFFVLTTKKASGINIKYAYTLGALTYPIYLIHAHFGFVMLNTFATDTNKIYAYIILIGATFTIAYLMHRVIEVGFKTVWKELFGKLLSPVKRLEDLF